MADIFEIELPELRLSEVWVGGIPGVWVTNRAPGPLETEVPARATVEFDLVQTGPGTPVDGEVYVNDVLAYTWSGGQQNGFTVAVSQHSSTVGGATDRWHFAITPAAAFESLSTNRVHGYFVRGDTNEQNGFDWSFSVEDLTRPQLLSVRALDERTIQVTFDEKVSDTALSVSNYRLRSLTVPAVEAVITAVSDPDGTKRVFHLAVDTELTAGATYELACVQIEDLFGNIVDETHAAGSFSVEAYNAPGRDFSLWNLLPEMNRREDVNGDLQTLLSLLQEPLDLLLGRVDRWVEILDHNAASEQYVDLMLEELGNPFPFDLTLMEKRSLIDVLVQIYREKGTEDGIKRAVRLFTGVGVEIETLDENLGYVVLGDSALGTSGPTHAAMVAGAQSPYAITTGTRLMIRAGRDGTVQVAAFGAAVSAPGPFQTGAYSVTIQNGTDQTVVNLSAGEHTAQQVADLVNSISVIADAWILANGRLCIASKVAGKTISIVDTQNIFGFSTIAGDLAGQYSTERLCSVINGQVDGIIAEIAGEMEAGFPGPYTITNGCDLLVQVDGGATQRLVFDEDLFGDTGYVGVDDLVASIASQIAGAAVGKTVDGRFRISSLTEAGSVRVLGGTALDAFGLGAVSTSGKRVRLNATVEGGDSVLEIPGHAPIGALSANSVLQLPEGVVEGAGHGFELWPGSRVAVYSFNVLCPTVLTTEQRERLVYVVNYMKPAHTHLREVVETREQSLTDHLRLGVSRLGQNWLLH